MTYYIFYSEYFQGGAGKQGEEEGTIMGLNGFDNIPFLKVSNVFACIHFKIMLHNLDIIFIYE